jgi:hypothetical protein
MDLRAVFLTQISPGKLRNIFLKSKVPRKISNQIFLFPGISLKKVIFDFRSDFDDNRSVIHAFINQIFKAAEKTSPFSAFPTGQGAG